MMRRHGWEVEDKAEVKNRVRYHGDVYIKIVVLSQPHHNRNAVRIHSKHCDVNTFQTNQLWWRRPSLRETVTQKRPRNAATEKGHLKYRERCRC